MGCRPSMAPGGCTEIGPRTRVGEVLQDQPQLVAAVCSCGNPGRRSVAGISNGCGKVRRWLGGGPELSIPGQIPQPGRAAGSTPGSRPAWLRRVGEGCGVLGMCPESRGQSPGPRGAAGRPCAAGFFSPHPLPLAFGSALSRMLEVSRQNETPKTSNIAHARNAQLTEL